MTASCQARVGSPPRFKLTTEASRVAERIAELESAPCRDTFIAERPLSSLIDLICADEMLQRFLPTKLPHAAQDEAVERTIASRRVLGSLARLTRMWANDGVLVPLDRWLVANAENKTDKFAISPIATDDSPTRVFEFCASMLTSASEQVFDREAWPAKIIRATSYLMSGRTEYRKFEIDQLEQGTEFGPLAYCVAAYAMTFTDRTAAQQLATRGLLRLFAAEVRKDYRPFLAADAKQRPFVESTVKWLRQLSDQEVEQLAATWFGEPAALADFVRPLRAAESDEAAMALLPDACDALWDSCLRERVEKTLLQLGGQPIRRVNPPPVTRRPGAAEKKDVSR